MITLEEMAKAHLINVQREIANLQESQKKIEEQVKQLTDYFNEGVKILNDKTASENVNRAQDVSSVFGG